MQTIVYISEVIFNTRTTPTKEKKILIYRYLPRTQATMVPKLLSVHLPKY